MRTSRGRRATTISYMDGSSPEGSPPAGGPDDEWVPRLDALPGIQAASLGVQAAAGAGEPAAAHQQTAAGAAAAHPALDWEEAELLGQLSPESQKRERRRIANRDCARRIRQRQTVSAPGRAEGRRPGCCGLRRLSPSAWVALQPRTFFGRQLASLSHHLFVSRSLYPGAADGAGSERGKAAGGQQPAAVHTHRCGLQALLHLVVYPSVAAAQQLVGDAKADR